MSSMDRRITKLGRIYGARGCATCRSWDTTIVEYGRRDQLPVHLDRPDRCPDCGRRAPDRTAVVQIIRPDDDDAEVLS